MHGVISNNSNNAGAMNQDVLEHLQRNFQVGSCLACYQNHQPQIQQLNANQVWCEIFNLPILPRKIHTTTCLLNCDMKFHAFDSQAFGLSSPACQWLYRILRQGNFSNHLPLQTLSWQMLRIELRSSVLGHGFLMPQTKHFKGKMVLLDVMAGGPLGRSISKTGTRPMYCNWLPLGIQTVSSSIAC